MKRFLLFLLFLLPITASAQFNNCRPGFCPGIFGSGFMPAPVVTGAQFFVAAPGNGGSDSNPGTQALPWATVAKVNSSASVGSVVKFNGGDTFTTATGITVNVSITSYGTGQATITSGNSAPCISQTNPSGLSITNVICTGGGTTTNTTDGILIQNTGSTNIAGPTITGVTVSGYGQNCIWLQAVNLGGFTGGTLGTGGAIGSAPTGAAGGGLTLHDCTGKVGVFTAGLNLNSGPNFLAPKTSFQNINASNIIAFNLNGYAGAGGSNWTGNGFWCEGCTGVTLSNFLIHDTGLNSNTSSGPGCGSVNFSDTVMIQYGEVYNCRTGNAIDGDGFDFDGDITNSSMHHLYVHDCDGYGLFGFSMGGTWAGNTYHDNIVVNCTAGQINIEATSGHPITGTNPVYNNTLYGASGILSAGVVSAQFYNNVVKCLGAVADSCVSVPTSATQVFAGNDYNGNGDFFWNGVSYPTLAAWQAATGQEKIGGVPVGSSAEPMLVTYGYKTTTNGYVPAFLPQYQLQASSAMLGGGIDITAQFGVAVWPVDYYGIARVSSSKVIGAGQAVVWSNGTGTCSQATTLFGRFTSPTVAEQQNDNALYCGGIVDGWMSTKDVYYNFAATTSANALLNWISTSFVPVTHATMTFTANKGYAGDAVSGYIDPQYTPSTAGGNCVQNSCAVGIYFIAGTPGSNNAAFGATTGSTAIDMFPFAVGTVFNTINDNSGFQPPTQATTLGVWIVSRTGATAASTSYNGVQVATSANTSVGLPNKSILIDAFNNVATIDQFAPFQISYWSMGGGLTAAQQVLQAYRENAHAAALGNNQF